MRLVLAVPGDLAAPTGGYAYARQILRHLPARGVAAKSLALPDGFPDPGADDLARTRAALAGVPAEAALLVDGLAYGALPPELIRAAGRPMAALVHHPLGYETGLSPERAATLVAGERAALALASHVVATSRYTARLLTAAFGVAPERITVAEPGTAPAARVAPRPGPHLRLLAVGTVSPRKGYDILVRALATLADLDWSLTIAGSLDRVPESAAALRRQIAAAGLAGRVALAGAVTPDALDALLAGADIAVSASLFEGYGMALTEALARGLPLVAATGGAAAETVPAGAGRTVPPGDAPALAAALRDLIADPARRAEAAAASWAAGQRLPDWPDTAASIAAALRMS
ncbi:glycosyl transferase family 1 [Methylobacterium indicum]|uniref:glycosyltransferase family 4 protein n=1 Tax=Methylobacterium indicum TaxID=1775910 RepID=UPI00073475FE|nr:glycosyltransferase family 4 protein [Methylobacterium indicum]KTS36477.1 glycosyl transferase family 1 [Methylobacterium indicum]KTS38044.1 glycosyl transferase family 1 [Methylobacterium indicum]KTS54050.1 glycosyl transferase family 1 [Methylobacterium indicum]